jgi:hypothetical protein
MSLATALTALADVPADLAELIGELCWLATAAHVVGDGRRRDEVVDLAGELAAERTVGLLGAH